MGWEVASALLVLNGSLIAILLKTIGKLGTSIDRLGDKLDSKVSSHSCKDIRDDCFRTCPTRQGHVKRIV